MKNLIKTSDRVIDVHFPAAGIDLTRAFVDQKPRQIGQDNEYARTTVVAQNVRAYERLAGRRRGGSRTGLKRYLSTKVGSTTFIVQGLDIIVSVEASPVQSSQSGRRVTLLAVSQGVVKYADAGATAWTTPTNNTGNTPPLNFSGLIQSTSLLQVQYFADGTNWVKFVPLTNSLETWTASAGSLPVDSDGNTPRIIATWRGRVVLSGLLLDPHNWFMSKVGDATNFDYAVSGNPPTMAVAGNNAPMGKIGDVVTAIIPYTDDILIFLCDSSVWMMRGDPMIGGQLIQITDAIGGAWGTPWCIDSEGAVYFFSNRLGVFSFVPGQTKPVRISDPIKQLLEDFDTGNTSVRLMWDERQQGLYVFATPLDAPAASTHYFWEKRTRAWSTITFVNPNFDPLCCCVFDGNDPDDRVCLIGSWDGYVRAFDPAATKDDGRNISSRVLIGPFVTSTLDDVMITEIQAVLGTESESVSWGLLSGKTPELALAATASPSGTWSAGRNPTNRPNKAAHAHYIEITSTNAWAMETIRIRLSTLGEIRQRGA